MAKHIHIHLPRRQARDAGWDESKHKRDHGKFSSTGGSSGSGVEVKHQPSGTQVQHAASKVGPGTQTHHSALKSGDALYDKTGSLVDYVESIGRAMHAGERTIHTRAGYQHQTQGGHLPNGMHTREPGAKVKLNLPKAPKLSDAEKKAKYEANMKYFASLLTPALQAQAARPGGAPGSEFQGRGEPSRLEKEAKERGGYGIESGLNPPPKTATK